jgi:hypothetical protein
MDRHRVGGPGWRRDGGDLRRRSRRHHGSEVGVAGKIEPDDIVIFEVMTESLDHAWWGLYRERLARRFSQDDLVVRASPMERL